MKKSFKNKYLVVANWKDSIESFGDAKKDFDLVKKIKFNIKKAELVICPPVVFLSELARNYRGKNIVFGSQNISITNKKPCTGEVSVAELKNLDVEYVIIGHSERRSLGESNEIISKKIAVSIDNKLTPILCVGEIVRDKYGEYLKDVERQLIEGLSEINKKDLNKVIVAYEPVFAIGKGHKSLTTYEIHQMVIFIKKILVSRFNKKVAMEVPIIYGGSVDEENSSDILSESEVQGILIGRAGTNPYSLKEIIRQIK